MTKLVYTLASEMRQIQCTSAEILMHLMEASAVFRAFLEQEVNAQLIT